MKAIDSWNWLSKPWLLMSHNEFYRHYQYRDTKHNIDQNLIVVRTSDKCYKVVNWRTTFNVKSMSKIELCSVRSWTEFKGYAASIV